MNRIIALRPHNAVLFGVKFNVMQTAQLSFIAALFEFVFPTRVATMGAVILAVMLYRGVSARTALILCAYSSALDVLTTWMALSAGLASEANVAALYLMGIFGPVKTMLAMKSLLLFAIYRAYRLRTGREMGYCLAAYAVFTTCIAINNFSFILDIFL